MSGEPTYSPADLEYIATDYRTLEQLCAGRDYTPARVREHIAEGRLPRATYVLPDGVEVFPLDYFALVDDAGAVEALPDHFRSRYAAAGGAEHEADEDWQGYLSGQFGVCLRSVTPEAMVAKTRLIAAIEQLLAAPSEASEAWRAGLRENVAALDALERPFTDCDRLRWGDTSRDRYITRVRRRYPAAFAASALT
jgi:hypothetical protein